MRPFYIFFGKQMKNKLFILFLFMFMISSSAQAYIDPATGSTIVSTLIGLFVALGIIIKTYWYKLKAFFIKKKK